MMMRMPFAVVPRRSLLLLTCRVLPAFIFCIAIGSTVIYGAEQYTYEDRMAMARERLVGFETSYYLFEQRMYRIQELYDQILSRLDIERPDLADINGEEIESLVSQIYDAEATQAGAGSVLAGTTAVLAGLFTINLSVDHLSSAVTALANSIDWGRPDMPIDIIEASITEIDNEFRNADTSLNRITMALVRIHTQLDRLELRAEF